MCTHSLVSTRLGGMLLTIEQFPHIAMVVISALRGIQVTIRVNGNALPEYEDDEDGDEESGLPDRTRPKHKVSKYIESTEGQEFGINISVSNPYEMDCPALGFTIIVDGKKVGGRVMEKSDYHNRGSWTGSRNGINKGKPGETGVFRAFTFSAIKTCECRSKWRKLTLADSFSLGR